MNKKALWKSVLERLQQSREVNEMSLTTWIEPLQPLHFAEGVLLLRCDNPFGLEVLNSSYKPILQRVASEIDPTVDTIRFTLEESVPVPKASDNRPSEEEQKASESQKNSKTEERAQKAKPKRYQHPLNQQFTFETFITAHENSFAYNAATAIVENPGARRFNPLYLFGETGAGKSHLLHAIGNRIGKERPNFKIVLTTAEEFYYNFASSLHNKSIAEFHNAFLNADLLLIDEIHNFAGKENSQMELFKIFNKLHQQNKQIVCTADRPPEELKGIDERLISRLQWGLTAGIQPAKEETRTAILQEMAQKEGIPMTKEVLTYIAEEGPTNAGELEGIIIRLSAHHSVYGQEITLDIAKEQLNRPITSEEQQFTAARIIAAVSKYYGVDTELMLGKGRSKEVAHARQVGMFIAKQFTSHSLKQVGIEFGGRDHSTVVHAVKSITKKEEEDAEIRNDIQKILSSCRTMR